MLPRCAAALSVVLSFGLLGWTRGEARETDDDHLTILSQNIFLGANLESLVEAAHGANAALILIQEDQAPPFPQRRDGRSWPHESGEHHSDYLARRLNSRVGTTRYQALSSNDCAAIVDLSRWHVRRSQHANLALPETHSPRWRQLVGWCIGAEPPDLSNVQALELERIGSGAGGGDRDLFLRVLNLHLRANAAPEGRQAQLKQALDWVSEELGWSGFRGGARPEQTNDVVVGDLNALHLSLTHAARDAMRRVASRVAGTREHWPPMQRRQLAALIGPLVEAGFRFPTGVSDAPTFSYRRNRCAQRPGWINVCAQRGLAVWSRGITGEDGQRIDIGMVRGEAQATGKQVWLKGHDHAAQCVNLRPERAKALSRAAALHSAAR